MHRCLQFRQLPCFGFLFRWVRTLSFYKYFEFWSTSCIFLFLPESLNNAWTFGKHKAMKKGARAYLISGIIVMDFKCVRWFLHILPILQLGIATRKRMRYGMAPCRYATVRCQCCSNRRLQQRTRRLTAGEAAAATSVPLRARRWVLPASQRLQGFVSAKCAVLFIIFLLYIFSVPKFCYL
jgi:hypothetical protein